MQKNIYIVFSATPYRIGSMIRQVTREEYNHVSVSLDKEMTQMFSFARRAYHTPLHGGFVKEHLSRYSIGRMTSKICVCEIPVTDQQFQDLSTMLNKMHMQQERYLYNHLSVLAAPFRKKFSVRDSYTCVEFCVNILQTLSLPVSTNHFYTIYDLLNILKPYIVYTGKMQHAT